MICRLNASSIFLKASVITSLLIDAPASLRTRLLRVADENDLLDNRLSAPASLRGHGDSTPAPQFSRKCGEVREPGAFRGKNSAQVLRTHAARSWLRRALQQRAAHGATYLKRLTRLSPCQIGVN
eukprot:3627786-Pyramimonas_sp.AAC.1